MSNGNGHRWSRFWWQDYLNDQELKLCSLAAQGLWMRLLCVMHAADGHLLVSGVQPNCREIAKLLSVSERQISRYLDELLQRGVARRNNDGVIYCQRMVNDIKAEAVGREAADRRWNGPKPNGPPNGGGSGQPYSNAYRDPNAKKLEAEEERRPPRNPPANGGVARRGYRNGFHEYDRREFGGTNVADFHQVSRRLAGGSDG